MDIKENDNERSYVPNEIDEKVSTKSALEEHIDTVSKKINVNLEMHGNTPAVGNCWYEACASLMKYNKMRDISAKQLRKEVVDNIDNCENFSNVFEMVFGSDYDKFAKFKEKHHQEGQFTDEDGIMVLATGYYLGITLRIFSESNSKLQPYTEYNENNMIIFNVFLDDRSKNSEHFQSLKQPNMGQLIPNNLNTKISEANEKSYDLNTEISKTDENCYNPEKISKIKRSSNDSDEFSDNTIIKKDLNTKISEANEKSYDLNTEISKTDEKCYNKGNVVSNNKDNVVNDKIETSKIDLKHEFMDNKGNDVSSNKDNVVNDKIETSKIDLTSETRIH